MFMGTVNLYIGIYLRIWMYINLHHAKDIPFDLFL